MCGRFTLYAKGEILAGEFGVSGVPPEPPRYNIAPSRPVMAVRADAAGGREAALLRWGLVPSWSRDPAVGSRLINARSETVRGKQPYYVRMRDGRVFAFAGLWERWEAPEGGAVETCTILTTGANAVLAPIHDRMPVILARPEYGKWLDPAPKDTDSLVPLA